MNQLEAESNSKKHAESVLINNTEEGYLFLRQECSGVTCQDSCGRQQQRSVRFAPELPSRSNVPALVS